jgi:hypothetical protein
VDGCNGLAGNEQGSLLCRDQAEGEEAMSAEDIYVDKLAYARSLFDGAGRISSTARDAPIEKIGIPFYLLVGFGIENALKGFLGYKRLPPGKWEWSHDLSALLGEAKDLGLSLPEHIPEFIENLSRFHKEFWFRYPEKAGVADVNSAATALYAAEMLMRAVFDATDARLKLP